MNYLFIFLILFSTCYLSAQSGWTKVKGEYFTKLDISNLSANKYYTPSGTELITAKFNQTSVNFYGEYGIKDRLTMIASMPLLRINSFDTSESVYGMGDLKLELKYRLLKGFPLSVSLAPELPIGRSNAFAANKINPLDRINLPTGDGEFNVWSTIAASGSIGKIYSSVFVSYNYRTKYKGLDFRDLYQFGFELGANPLHNLWLNTKIKAQFSTGESKHVELGFVRGDATTYTLISFEAFYKLSNSLGISGTILSGGNFIVPFQNIYVAPYFSFGVIYEYKK